MCCLFCLQCYMYSQSSRVSPMLEDLNWPLLRECPMVIALTMSYKINCTLVNIPHPSEITLRFPNARQSSDLVFMHLPSSVNAYKYSFCPYTIPEWNRLPIPVIHAILLFTLRPLFCLSDFCVVKN